MPTIVTNSYIHIICSFLRLRLRNLEQFRRARRKAIDESLRWWYKTKGFLLAVETWDNRLRLVFHYRGPGDKLQSSEGIRILQAGKEAQKHGSIREVRARLFPGPE